MAGRPWEVGLEKGLVDSARTDWTTADSGPWSGSIRGPATFYGAWT